MELDPAGILPDESGGFADQLSRLGRDAAEESLIRSAVNSYATLFDQAMAGGDVESIAGDSIRLHDALAQGRLLRATAALACMTACYRGGFYQTIAALTAIDSEVS